MSWNGQDNNTAAVCERGFTLDSNDRSVPGIYWTPTDGDAKALVLLGHGGNADKKVEYIELIAHGLCSHGIAAMAIDGPGHGDRPGADQWQASDPSSFRSRWESDGGTEAIVADWKAALDFIEAQDRQRVTGWLGFSMGTMMGLPVCVADKRIKVAVLGLMGFWGPNKKDLIRLAPDLSIPVRYFVQWDDEVVPRDSCLELFDALGSKRKSLHGNPGAHSALPTFEVEDAVVYLDKQLAKTR